MVLTSVTAIVPYVLSNILKTDAGSELSAIAKVEASDPALPGKYVFH